MKNTIKFLGIIALAAIIGFTMTACGDDGEGEEFPPDLNGIIILDPEGIVTIGTEVRATYTGTEMVSYQWSRRGNDIPDATTNKYTPLEEGQYYVTVSAKGFNSMSKGVEVIDPDHYSVVTPWATPPGGIYPVEQNVTLTTTTADTIIYYTTDETDPTPGSWKYTGAAIKISATTVLKAYAVKGGNTISATMTEVYIIGGNSGVQTFNSITVFKAWLNAQPANNAGTAYSVKLNVRNLGGSASTDGSVGKTLLDNNTKYVSLDLSGSTLTTIEGSAFAGCRNLTSVKLPDSVTTIGYAAFSNCFGLTSVNIPDNVTSIGGTAFAFCTSLTSVTIPKNVTTMESFGMQAFGNCTNLTAINVNADNTAYSSQDGILYNKNKTTLFVYPAKKTGVSFTIPNSVTDIKAWAFESCTNLTSVTIGSGVTSIGEYAFSGCINLTSVTFNKAGTTLGTQVFIDAANTTSLQSAYTAGGGGIGTYTRPDKTSTTWTKSS